MKINKKKTWSNNQQQLSSCKRTRASKRLRSPQILPLRLPFKTKGTPFCFCSSRRTKQRKLSSTTKTLTSAWMGCWLSTNNVSSSKTQTNRKSPTMWTNCSPTWTAWPTWAHSYITLISRLTSQSQRNGSNSSFTCV